MDRIAARKNETGWLHTRRAVVLREMLANTVLAMLFARFAYSFGVSFLESLRISLLLLFAKEVIDVFFVIFRKLPKELSLSPYAWVIAIAGTWAPLFFVPVGGTDFFWNQLAQFVGLVWQIAAVLSLNRSFGIVPANRGIKKRGLYGIVRHPLYLGYLLNYVAFASVHISSRNVVVLLCCLGFAVLRILEEERFLSRDPDYSTYCLESVKWRLVPLLF